MRNTKVIVLVLLACSFSACGQFYKQHKHQQSAQVEIEKLTKGTVRAALRAWQSGNSKKWLSYFAPDAKLLDDGHTRNFKRFSIEAIGHERFLSVDKLEDNGMSIYGQFHSDQWGDFKTYFKFRINAAGKFDQLEIGKADD